MNQKGKCVIPGCTVAGGPGAMRSAEKHREGLANFSGWQYVGGELYCPYHCPSVPKPEPQADGDGGEAV
jgi:hypothetical protein